MHKITKQIFKGHIHNTYHVYFNVFFLVFFKTTVLTLLFLLFSLLNFDFNIYFTFLYSLQYLWNINIGSSIINQIGKTTFPMEFLTVSNTLQVFVEINNFLPKFLALIFFQNGSSLLLQIMSNNKLLESLFRPLLIGWLLHYKNLWNGLFNRLRLVKNDVKKNNKKTNTQQKNNKHQ